MDGHSAKCQLLVVDIERGYPTYNLLQWTCTQQESLSSALLLYVREHI